MHKAILTICIVIFTSFAYAQQNISREDPETDRSTIGYPSVDAALGAMQDRRDVEFSHNNNYWIIVNDIRENNTLWSFAPPGDAVYPTAIKRTLMVNKDGIIHIDMNVLCQADKASCDKLDAYYKVLNEKTQEPVVIQLNHEAGLADHQNLQLSGN